MLSFYEFDCLLRKRRKSIDEAFNPKDLEDFANMIAQHHQPRPTAPAPAPAPAQVSQQIAKPTPQAKISQEEAMARYHKIMADYEANKIKHQAEIDKFPPWTQYKMRNMSKETAKTLDDLSDNIDKIAFAIMPLATNVADLLQRLQTEKHYQNPVGKQITQTILKLYDDLVKFVNDLRHYMQQRSN